MTTDSPVVKIQAVLPTPEYEELERRAKELGLSANEYLRRALADENMLADLVDKGAKVFIQQPDGSLERVEFKVPA